MAAFRLTSPAFDHDDPLPARFTADKEGVSPPLEWEGVPPETKELVLICDDPDAEAGVVTHWLVYGMLPDCTALPEGIPDDAIVEDDELSLVQGLNEFDEVGYTGPSMDDDSGPHRVFFRLFALDVELDLRPGIVRSELRKAAKDHIIAQAELVGII
jgi:Raf kinase inhibitor-like YbhB/YbcL family protein